MKWTWIQRMYRWTRITGKMINDRFKKKIQIKSHSSTKFVMNNNKQGIYDHILIRFSFLMCLKIEIKKIQTIPYYWTFLLIISHCFSAISVIYLLFFSHLLLKKLSFLLLFIISLLWFHFSICMNKLWKTANMMITAI